MKPWDNRSKGRARGYLPRTFELLVSGDKESRPCFVSWQTRDRVTVGFLSAPHKPSHSEAVTSPSSLVRGSLVMLRASLDEVDFGVVLLDADLRVTFVNRAFRQVWWLTDADCSSHPPFAELMRHGRTAHHHFPSPSLEDKVQSTLQRVDCGDSTPVDLRLPDGEVLRFQCVKLPGGGRMLSYNRVTDIVRQVDDLAVLRDAIDNVDQGVVLIDSAMQVRFVNKKAISLWGLTPQFCESQPSVADYIAHVRNAGLYGVPDDSLNDYVVKRVTMIKAGDTSAIDIPVQDGRTIRAQCTPLIGGGRMLTYTDVSDLVQRAEQQELLATTDLLTGLNNRRSFMRLAEAEWDRFQRYQHGFSILFFDIDNFKAINDRLGHEAGDLAIMRVAQICEQQKRRSDILARMGGDEFIMLLPQTDAAASASQAERLHNAIGLEPLDVDGVCINLTVSVGIAVAAATTKDLNELIKTADAHLYQAKKAGRNRISLGDCRSEGPAAPAGGP